MDVYKGVCVLISRSIFRVLVAVAASTLRGLVGLYGLMSYVCETAVNAEEDDLNLNLDWKQQ